MTPRDEAISNAVQDAIKIWKDKYDKAMARAINAEIKLSEMEEQDADVLDYETQLRDQFAIAAINAFIVSDTDGSVQELSFAAYQLADSMMATRKERTNVS